MNKMMTPPFVGPGQTAIREKADELMVCVHGIGLYATGQFGGEVVPSELSGRMREIEQLTEALRRDVNQWLDEWANRRNR